MHNSVAVLDDHRYSLPKGKFNARVRPSSDHRSKISLISSNESNNSVHQQLQRLNSRFTELVRQRRLLNNVLVVYVLIMFGLLVIALLLLRAYLTYVPVIYEEVIITPKELISGGNTYDCLALNHIDMIALDAQYGHICTDHQDCQHPFRCEKQNSSVSRCQCPLKYDLIQDQCLGNLNAICRKDKDCQRYMICSGMSDGKRRCHCQKIFHYDDERKQCRGEYHAPCESHLDCQGNLQCERTNSSSCCSCPKDYRYDRLEMICRGYPGARCDSVTDPCIENAQCRDGACECAHQYIPDRRNQRCIDPCPDLASSPARIRYPGNCRRFIDCQRRLKTECPDVTIFNFRTQLCDYRKNVIDCP